MYVWKGWGWRGMTVFYVLCNILYLCNCGPQVVASTFQASSVELLVFFSGYIIVVLLYTTHSCPRIDILPALKICLYLLRQQCKYLKILLAVMCKVAFYWMGFCTTKATVKLFSLHLYEAGRTWWQWWKGRLEPRSAAAPPPPLPPPPPPLLPPFSPFPPPSPPPPTPPPSLLTSEQNRGGRTSIQPAQPYRSTTTIFRPFDFQGGKTVLTANLLTIRCIKKSLLPSERSEATSSVRISCCAPLLHFLHSEPRDSPYTLSPPPEKNWWKK